MRTALSVIFVSAALLACDVALADTIKIGVPPFSTDMNYMESSHPAAEIVRDASAAYIIKSAPSKRGGPPFVLDLSDSLSVSADHKLWSFRVSQAAMFSNGKRVQQSDLNFSFNRCKEREKLSGIERLEVKEKPEAAGGTALWVEVAFVPQPGGTQVPMALTECPILESRSAKLFGVEFGKNGDFIAGGPYNIVELHAAKDLRLEPAPAGRRKTGMPEALEISVFATGEQGLSALRAGTIDLFYSEDSASAEKAKNDETLSLLECSKYRVIVRRGLNYVCPPHLDVMELGYKR